MKNTAISVGGGRFVRTAALCITLAALSACGQKGPLTLAKPA
ncbi:hypothetical protein DBR42_20640, partial [Pelomonas sp. HMWF004]